MKSKVNRPVTATELRRKAEAKARINASQAREALSPEETRQTLQDLRVHQIEMEMQNEEFRRAQAELNAARARYFDLYNLAPVGYVTISEQGLILEANFTAATMLGLARGMLVKRPLTRFILPEDQDIYYRHRKLLFETGAPQVCEFRMLRVGAAPFWARVEATMAQDGEGLHVCRAVLGDITKHKRAEEALLEAQAILKAAMDNSPAGIAIADAPSGALRYVNDAGLLIRGGDRENVVNGIGIDQYVARWQLLDLDGSPLKTDEVPLARAILFGETCNREFIIRRSGDDDRTVLANAAPIMNDNNEIVAGIVVFMDITDSKQAEERLAASLREKELLLKEIHHRVKNNLQIISSLLNLQARSIGNETLEEIFRESQDRITAMASVHSLLYKSQNFAEINFGEYVRETASQLFRSYKTSSAAIALVVHAEDIMLPIDTAIPCGLIINELITNTLKYAFPGAREGEIKIAMNRTESGIKLHYEDNGIGFPKDVDFCNTETLGLKLVHMLVKQLDGNIEQFINGGTRYEIMLKSSKLPEV